MNRGSIAAQCSDGVDERGSSKLKLARIVDGKRRELNVTPTDLVQPEDTLIVKERFF